MVKVPQSWPYPQNSALQLPDLNCMNSSLEPRQLECLPARLSPVTWMFPENTSLPGFAVPGLATSKTQQINDDHMLLKAFPSHIETAVLNMLPSLQGKSSAFTYGFTKETVPNETPGSLHKRLLVFDQSGSGMRLLYSSLCPAVMRPPATARNADLVRGPTEEQAVKTGQLNPGKPILSEGSDENPICIEESEMHEDTEEINALLYSDDDDDYSQDDDDYSQDDDDDEVMSTDHSPIGICMKRERTETTTEEIATSDFPNKKQKMLKGGYTRSSEVVTSFPVKPGGSNEYENDAESSYVDGGSQRDKVGSISGDDEYSKKDKIRRTLRILENIIPGVKGKDPLLVLDDAIDYLQSLKIKANGLGVNYH